MPRVTILPVDLSTDVGVGESLLDAGTAAGVEMAVGCCNCSCGACVVQILQGMDQLGPPSSEEIKVLYQLSRDPHHFRLACCTRVKPGADAPVTVRQVE